MFPAIAIAGAVTAYAAQIAALTPEQRRDFLARQAQRREEERLDASEEVKLAREMIAGERLRGEHAERLLDFARTLAKRREF